MKPNTQTEQSRNGKGDKPHTNTASKQYQENYTQINWTKHTTGKSESISTRISEPIGSKYHRCLAGIIQLEDMQGLIPDGPLTPFAQAMPDQYKDADAVKAYRAYYIGEKKAFAKWKAGNTPQWWK
jgi:hypothetical protein